MCSFIVPAIVRTAPAPALYFRTLKPASLRPHPFARKSFSASETNCIGFCFVLCAAVSLISVRPLHLISAYFCALGVSGYPFLLQRRSVTSLHRDRAKFFPATRLAISQT